MGLPAKARLSPAARAEEFLSGCGLAGRDCLRLRLTIEETLLKYQEALGPDGAFSIRCVKRLGRGRVELAFPGERLDPALSQEETDSEVLRSLLAGVGMLGLFLPFFSLSGSGNASFNFRELLEMVLDIVPGNFFTPFTEGNPLQIIFVAVLIGLALLVLGSKTTVAASFIEQSNYIVQLIMEGISALVPLFVFGSIFTMILNKNFAALAGAYKWPLLVLLGEMALAAVYLLTVSIRKRAGIGTLAKKLFPTFLICLSTASSSAAFSTNVETCEKDLGIDRRIVNFGIPLGQVVFMPGAIALFLAAGLCMGELYQVEMSPGWLASALLIAVVLAVAAPPVPGGALTCYTMLFTQLNVPNQAITIAITLNIIMDFVATAVNVLCLQAELVELAGGMDMLDVDALRQRR